MYFDVTFDQFVILEWSDQNKTYYYYYIREIALKKSILGYYYYSMY